LSSTRNKEFSAPDISILLPTVRILHFDTGGKSRG